MTRKKLYIALALALAFGSLALTVAALPALADAPLTPQASPLDVVISEIAWMGTTASYNDEWIELYNTTGSSIDLTGWTLDAADGTPSISLSGVISPGGYYLLERTDDDPVPGVPADLTYTGALGNDGEDLVLRDSAANVVDRVNCSAGWFAGHNEARVPMVRVSTTASGSVTSTWTYNPRCGTATNSTGVSRTCELSTTYVEQPLDYAVYFNDLFTATTITTATTPMESALLSLIDGAEETIDVALYGLNRQSVVDALIDAHDRDVMVQVVGDDDAASGAYSTWYQALEDGGITVVTDASGYIQHNKFFVIDSEIVWTGSTNLTDNGFTRNANNSIVITDTALASVYLTEFDEMWAGDFQRTKTDNTPHLFDYDGLLVESYFSPTDLTAFEVWNTLANADATVHFAMFFWTDDMLAERVIERMDDGVEVYGVWDQLGAASPYSVDEDLIYAGAKISVENWPGKLHHKFAVIDVEGSDPTVILGSYNWTSAGAYDNDENTLIIHDATLARAYYDEWERLWLTLNAEPEQETLGVELGPDYTREAEAGETILYDHVITNTGTVTDTFVIEFASRQGWPTQLLGGDYPTGTLALPLRLGPQMTMTLQVSLTVPADAGGTEVIVITATSQLTPTVKDTAMDTTIVRHSIYLPLVARNWPPLPNKPTLNSISNADGDGAYTVSWTEQPSRQAITYTLQEATNAAFTADLRTVCTTGQQSCSVNGRTAGNYYYRVQGHNDWGDSEWSNVQSVAVLLPDAPTLDSIENADGDGSYEVAWGAADRATRYVLEEDTDAAFNDPTKVYDGAGRSWMATGKLQGAYYYRVKAIGPTGESTWSDTRSATVSPPANVQITHIEYDPPGADVQGEYVEIKNAGGRPADMTDWTLRDDANHVFTFPTFTLNAGASVRVWTKGGADTATDLYWGSGSAIWNNTGDCAYLGDDVGTSVDTYCY